jgi:hypothetical protein
VRACGGGCSGEGVKGGGGSSKDGWPVDAAAGVGWSSGIGILLRCTVRLDGGVYVFRGGSSSLMRCSPAGFESYTTYWCRFSDRVPALTSEEIG